MNVTNRLGSWRRLVGLFVIGVLWASPEGAAQTQPDNPLRQAVPVVQKPASTVRTASAVEPITAARKPVVRSRGGSGSPYRMASYGFNAPRHEVPGYVPRHEVVSGVAMQMPGGAEPIPEGEMLLEPLPGEGEMLLEPLPGEGEVLEGDCCGGAESCGSCASCNGCLIPCPVFSLRNFEFAAGVQGFTASPNQGSSGSFGFHYGLNWAAPVPCTVRGELGMQLGFRGVSSNYSGSDLTPDSRTQAFVTGGLFRRVDWGLQGGVAFDYLKDDWYYEADLTQIRGELSWVYPACHELGFWCALQSGNDTSPTTVERNGQQVIGAATFETLDMYAVFYRRRFEGIGGGYGRIFAGFTGDSDGLLGADIMVPLNENWALKSGFTYVIPDEANKQIAYLEEAWNVGISLVWYPGERKSVGNDYYRPLFDVADNGSMIPRIR